MIKRVQLTKEDLRGLAQFLREGSPRSMSISTVDPEGNLSSLFNSVEDRKSKSESYMDNKSIKFRVGEKHRAPSREELKDMLSILGIDPDSLLDKNRIKEEPAERLIERFYEEFKNSHPELTSREKSELDKVANYFKDIARDIDEVIKNKKQHNGLDTDGDEIENDDDGDYIVRAVTPEGIKTIGKLVNGEIVPCSEEENKLIDELDSQLDLQSLFEDEEVPEFDEIEEYNDEYEDNLVDMYMAAVTMGRNSRIESINGHIELISDDEGIVRMNVKSKDIDIFDEMFDLNDIDIEEEPEEQLYPIGSKALNDVYQQNPNMKFTFVLNGVDLEVAKLFNGEQPRTLSEILTYAYIASGNDANVYNQVMNNMVLKACK